MGEGRDVSERPGIQLPPTRYSWCWQGGLMIFQKVYVCVCVCARAHVHMVSQKTICWSQSSPSTIWMTRLNSGHQDLLLEPFLTEISCCQQWDFWLAKGFHFNITEFARFNLFIVAPFVKNWLVQLTGTWVDEVTINILFFLDAWREASGISLLHEMCTVWGWDSWAGPWSSSTMIARMIPSNV